MYGLTRAGTTLIGAAASRGTCAPAGTSVRCDVGNLAAGASVTLSLSVTAPASAGAVTNTVTASFDEQTNDSPTPDPKQDSVVARDPIEVTLVTGSVESWVPPGTVADLSTDPTGAGVATPGQSQVASAHIPAQASGRVASLGHAAGAFSCPAKAVCRTGDWIAASVPGTFLDPPLEFRLRWDASVVARKQSVRNFAVFYAECLDGCPVQTISRRCATATPTPLERPCLWAVKEEVDGDFSAVLIQDHNGYMR
jgi:hypothetical protein